MTSALTSIVFGARAAPYGLTIGFTQQFRAYGTYADGSTVDITKDVTWTSSDTTVATISPTGLSTGIATGTTNITASLSGIISLPVGLGVGSPVVMDGNTLLSLMVTPSKPTNLAVGSTQQFSVTYTYSDGSIDTDNPASHPSWLGAWWNSSDPSVATIDDLGKATGLRAGITYITSSEQGVNSPEVVLTVISP
jgi:uncharacterized protein YjdB